MKNYAEDFDESKKFILSYKIESGKIRIKLANGAHYIIPYSEENEKKVIAKMEIQVKNAKVKPLSIIEELLAITQPILLPFGFLAFLKHSSWFIGTVLGFVASTAIISLSRVIMSFKKQCELKKLNYFLEYKDELNEGLGISENIKLGVRKKVVKQIETQKEKNKCPLTVNNIDQYSLSDLRKLKENIERVYAFGFEEDTIEKKANEQVLKKTRQGNPIKNG